MVVVTIDSNQRSAVDLRVEDLRRLKIRRNQDEGLEAQACGLRGDSVRQISCGRAADCVKAKRLCIGQRYRHHAIFEAECGQANGIVLDIEIGGPDPRAKPWRLHQWSQAGRSLRLVGVRNRQQGAITPHIQRACGNGFAGKACAGVVEVESYLKRRKAVITD